MKGEKVYFITYFKSNLNIQKTYEKTNNFNKFHFSIKWL